MWPPAGTPQARHCNKETQREQIFDHERQRAGKQTAFIFASARRMSKRRQASPTTEGKFLETVGF